MGSEFDKESITLFGIFEVKFSIFLYGIIAPLEYFERTCIFFASIHPGKITFFRPLNNFWDFQLERRCNEIMIFVILKPIIIIFFSS